MQWGPQEAFLRQLAEETGKTPRALEEKPPLAPEGVRYLRAFSALSNSRPYGMAGPLPITITDVLAYTQLVGFSNGERLLRVVQILDNLWLQNASKKESK